MQALCCVRDCSGNPFARSEQKIGTESGKNIDKNARSVASKYNKEEGIALLHTSQLLAMTE